MTTIQVRMILENYRSSINGKTYQRIRASFPAAITQANRGSWKREGDLLVLTVKE